MRYLLITEKGLNKYYFCDNHPIWLLRLHSRNQEILSSIILSIWQRKLFPLCLLSLTLCVYSLMNVCFIFPCLGFSEEVPRYKDGAASHSDVVSR